MRRGLLHLIAAFLAACFAAAAQAAAAAPVEIAPQAEVVPVWQALRIVAPADRQSTPEQAAELAAGPGAIHVDSPDRVLGRGTVPYWALFSLYNPARSEQLRLLAFEATTQFDVRLYRRDTGGAWRKLTSVAEAAAGRIGGGTTHPVWALPLAPRQSAELLLRVEGPSVVRFPLFAYQPVGFNEHKRKSYVALGVALGGCLFIGVYVGMLRRYLDDNSVPLFTTKLAPIAPAGGA